MSESAADLPGNNLMGPEPKGVLGNLAFTSAYDLSARLDLRLKEGSASVADLLSALDAALTPAFSDIAGLKTWDDAGSGMGGDVSARRPPVLHQFLDALSTDDPADAERYLAELEAMLPPGSLCGVVNVLDAFDFAAAKTEAASLIRRFAEQRGKEI